MKIVCNKKNDNQEAAYKSGRDKEKNVIVIISCLTNSHKQLISISLTFS